MKHMVHILLVAIAVGISVRGVMGSGAIVEGSDNAEQFALLCRIYNVAKNPPIHHVDLRHPNKIVEDIDSINASFAEEKQFNETEQEGNSSVPHVKPTTTRESAVAKAMLRRITEKAHNILKEFKKTNITEEIEKIKIQFARVIFGENGNESHLCDGALNGVQERGAACGKPGTGTKGDHAGKNLVVDSLCLCAQNTDDGIENACKVKVGSKSDKHSWGKSPPSGSSSMWASIKKECSNLMHKAPKSTREAYEVLEDFLRHLNSGGVYRWGKNNVEGSSRKGGMLGTSAWKNGGYGTGPVCDGKKGSKGQQAGGICVYYGLENWEDNIEWLKKLKNALNATDALNNQTATTQRDIQKLQTLLHRAEETHEAAKVITETQKPVVPTNFQTAAKRLTAYSAAWRHHPHHFIILFAL